MLESESVSFSAGKHLATRMVTLFLTIGTLVMEILTVESPVKIPAGKSFRYYDFNILKSPGNCHGRGKSAVFGEQHND